MSGKVIQTLRASPLASILSEAELRVLANCGSIHEYVPGQFIVSTDGQVDAHLFLPAESQFLFLDSPHQTD